MVAKLELYQHSIARQARTKSRKVEARSYRRVGKGKSDFFFSTCEFVHTVRGTSSGSYDNIILYYDIEILYHILCGPFVHGARPTGSSLFRRRRMTGVNRFRAYPTHTRAPSPPPHTARTRLVNIFRPTKPAYYCQTSVACRDLSAGARAAGRTRARPRQFAARPRPPADEIVFIVVAVHARTPAAARER